MQNKVKLSAPWITFFREIEALFKEDPEVNVVHDEEKNIVKIFVDNDEKADALAKLLPGEKTFGNVTMTIEVIPANDSAESKISLFQKAFDGNPAFSFIKTVEGVFTMSYVVFRKKVVQFFNDDLGDLNGLCSTLYQDIAKDVFKEQMGIYFCTDPEDKVGTSSGK